MIHRIVKTTLRSIPCIVVVLIVVEILMTNQLVGFGHDLSLIDSKIYDLGQENDVLKQAVASASSLMTITQKATAMGFVDATHAKYITVGSDQLPVALNHPE